MLASTGSAGPGAVAVACRAAPAVMGTPTKSTNTSSDEAWAQPCVPAGVSTCSQVLSGMRPRMRKGVSAGTVAMMVPAVPANARSRTLATWAETRASVPAWAVLLRLGRTVSAWPSTPVAVVAANGLGVFEGEGSGLGVAVHAGGRVG